MVNVVKLVKLGKNGENHKTGKYRKIGQNFVKFLKYSKQNDKISYCKTKFSKEKFHKKSNVFFAKISCGIFRKNYNFFFGSTKKERGHLTDIFIEVLSTFSIFFNV